MRRHDTTFTNAARRHHVQTLTDIIHGHRHRHRQNYDIMILRTSTEKFFSLGKSLMPHNTPRSLPSPPSPAAYASTIFSRTPTLYYATYAFAYSASPHILPRTPPHIFCHVRSPPRISCHVRPRFPAYPAARRKQGNGPAMLCKAVFRYACPKPVPGAGVENMDVIKYENKFLNPHCRCMLLKYK